MAKKKRGLRRLPKELMSRKILRLLLDDFSLFGSMAFYFFVVIIAHFIGNNELFSRLVYAFLIAFIVVITIKSLHYKDRPQKEEFNIFMEKVIASSFPSTHTMVITTLAILLWLSYRYVWLLSIFSIISILVYMQRYISKKHFLVDIVGGIILSVIIVTFVVKVL